MKKWLLSTLAIGLAFSSNAEQLQQPYDKLKKQINIMSKIISSSLSQEQNVRRSGVSVEGYYLKSQGVVFEIGSSRGLNRLINLFGHDSELSFSLDNTYGVVATPPSAPTAPVAPIIISDDSAEAISIEVGRSMEAYEDAMDAWRDRVESTRELREEQREISYELRSLARKERDLQFEMRHADKDRETDLAKDLAELKEEMAKLNRKNDELKARADKEESSLKQRKSQREERIKRARDAYFAELDETITDTLCSYGAGLRKLAKSEHVTFVIDLGKNNGTGADKKIHAFTKQNIIDCVMEEKTPKQLLESANSYFF